MPFSCSFAVLLDFIKVERVTRVIWAMAVRLRMLFGLEVVFEDAEAVYFYLDAVAGLDGAYSGGSSGGDEVAGLERHGGGDVAEQMGDGEDEVAGAALLLDDAVEAGGYGDWSAAVSPNPQGSISSETMGPTGQKVSKPLPRVHWPSDFWMSRAVTSLTMM